MHQIKSRHLPAVRGVYLAPEGRRLVPSTSLVPVLKADMLATRGAVSFGGGAQR